MNAASHSGLSLGILTGSTSRQAGGLFDAVRRLALDFDGLGVRVGVHALRDQFSAADYDAWAPLKPHLHSKMGPASLGYAPDIGRAIGAGNYDVTHLHGIWQLQSLAVLNWKRATGRPVVISPHGMLDPWALSHSGWKKRIVGALFENLNLREADCLHALNASEASSMRSFGLENPIAIIPNGTDLPELTPDQRDERQGRKTLLFLGRIHPKKGLVELIHAWGMASKAHPQLETQWNLVIAGWDDGGHEAMLKQLVGELDLRSSITFTGPAFDEAKDKLLRQADCFILPSFSEGLPMSVLEAWSYALPVLMTAHCNLPEGFERGAAVEVSTNPEALASQLGKALFADGLKAMGLAGRSLVEAEFTWPRIAEQHIAVYNWMLGRVAKPDCVQLEAIE